jgi:hypothetical protein
MNRFRVVTLWIGLTATLAAAGCGRSGDSPVAAVRHFLEVMERSRDQGPALREAFHLLDASAQGALIRRAERASTLSGRPYEPYQMLAQGRFVLRFTPTSPRGMTERVQGDRAVVTVTGPQRSDRAEIPLVREGGRWRIQLAIPPMRNEG